MRLLPLIYLVASLTLAACSIPYQTPQARAQIEQDLGVSANDIVAISESGFCRLKYGSEAVCDAEHGLAVLTRQELILSLYKNDKYVPAHVLKTADVLCGHTATSREAAEALNMFTTDYTFVLLPVDAQHKWNGPMHRQMIDYLLADGQPLLIGRGGKSSRLSDKEKMVSGMIPGTKIPFFTEFKYSEQFNPCPVAKG
ncbi:hypothetical protein J3D54_003967 [Pseudomonas sp. GGS8]|uniref:hypothetical protein n=1 Tax=Pseudomonas sp. GGS8 TaxID=2817892 RepID=UPI00209DC0B3|nr:hypothetical protein [Pseudomonas sp. GGS8]MCP1444835.1 hypothetical protein [Pseudomonas sp. GGS8]